MFTQLKPNVYIVQHDTYLHNNTIVIVQPDNLIIIDPSFNLDVILKKFKYKHLIIALTHAHSDHVGQDFMHACVLADEIIVSNGMRELLKRKFFNELFFGANFIDVFPKKWRFVKDDTELYELSFILTPGHSIDGMCINYADLLITGDCLFATDIGRTDFPWSDNMQMNNSLIKLKKWITNNPIKWIIPGHDEWITKTEILKTHQWLLAIR